MFESVSAAPPDPILGLSEAFNKDDRPEKVNLTIGVYCDEQGRTPVLEVVKKAETRLLEKEATKTYLGIAGLPSFLAESMALVLGSDFDTGRVAAFQTPGGTAALRVAAEFLASSHCTSRVWLSQPTWPNHPSIFQAAGLRTETYNYLTPDRTAVDFSAMMEALEQQGRAGDAVCLHACCHNPTGADLTVDQWAELAELLSQRGMLPLVDFAYLGFGDGLQEDRQGLSQLLQRHEELIVCTSYSKNFGLYSERVAALLILTSNHVTTENVSSNVKRVVRPNYSNPPRHGGAIVAEVLGDNQLRQQWEAELAVMRDRINSVRHQLVERLQAHGAAKDFRFLLHQKGMFSFSGLSPLQVDWLRKEKGVYIVGSGRINVAGINSRNVDYVARSICEALQV
ncbi:MAG: aromatic amino acid aminotransferase [Pirellulaceae bacterium]|nr:MAG: aromatic amino acid aminotransferase [Pirellulaceae bacterium]